MIIIMRNMKVMVISIVIRVLRTVNKGLEKRLELWRIDHLDHSTTKIGQDTLKSDRDRGELLSLRLHWNTIN